MLLFKLLGLLLGFWVEVNDIDMRPLAGLPCPALRVFLAGPFIDERALLKQSPVQASMALSRCHKADGAVAMLMVCPSAPAR